MEISSHDLYGDFSREEAKRRFPELNDIRDEELREMTIGVVQNMPDYFWTAPAAKRHHPPEHRQRHGLWLYSKRVCTSFERVTQSMVKQGHLSWEDIDMGRAACIIKEIFKHGMPPTSVTSPQNNHDILAANWLEDNTEMPQKVIGCVRAQNGAWYEGRNPQNHLEQMVHIADLYASDTNNHVAVKDLHPVLEDAFPRVDER